MEGDENFFTYTGNVSNVFFYTKLFLVYKMFSGIQNGCSDPVPGLFFPGAKMPGYRCLGKTDARVPSCPGDICPGAYG